MLAEIDPRPYAAAVMQAEGNLRQAEAQLKIDALDVERNRKLAKDNYVDQADFRFPSRESRGGPRAWWRLARPPLKPRG